MLAHIKEIATSDFWNGSNSLRKKSDILPVADKNI